MAPKKKPVKNAFYFFMVDVRRREEARGNHFKDMKEVSVYASTLWEELSQGEKDEYTRRAAEHKRGEAGDLSKKFTSLGVSFAVVDAEAKEEDESYSVMKKTVRGMISALNWGTTLRTFRFYLCHVNHFYKTDSGKYAIAEMALAEFCLKDGLTNTLHFFVDPGEFPLGYRFQALEWSRKTHGIPCADPTWKCGEKNYLSLFKRVKDFIFRDNNGVIPPVYTVDDSLNNNTCLSAVKCAFSTLCEAAYEDTSLFRVYPLNQLFYELRNKCGEGPDFEEGVSYVPSLAIINGEIERDVFSYARDLGCAYHEEQDLSFHCSLSIVTRWVYTICDHCCKHVKLPLVPGAHCPLETDVGDYKVPKKTFREKHNKVVSKTDPKTTNCVMPTIIDHGKMKEIEEMERRNHAHTRPPKDEELRLPRKALGYAGVAKYGSLPQPSPQINSKSDFPAMGYAGAAKCDSSFQPPAVPNSSSDFPAIGDVYRPAVSRGRGIMNRNIGSSLTQDFSNNTWSVGRGSRLK